MDIEHNETNTGLLNNVFNEREFIELQPVQIFNNKSCFNDNSYAKVSCHQENFTDSLSSENNEEKSLEIKVVKQFI